MLTFEERVGLNVLGTIGPGAQAGLVVHVEQATDQRLRLGGHEGREGNLLRGVKVRGNKG